MKQGFSKLFCSSWILFTGGNTWRAINFSQKLGLLTKTVRLWSTFHSKPENKHSNEDIMNGDEYQHLVVVENEKVLPAKQHPWKRTLWKSCSSFSKSVEFRHFIETAHYWVSKPSIVSEKHIVFGSLDKGWAMWAQKIPHICINTAPSTSFQKHSLDIR